MHNVMEPSSPLDFRTMNAIIRRIIETPLNGTFSIPRSDLFRPIGVSPFNLSNVIATLETRGLIREYSTSSFPTWEKLGLVDQDLVAYTNMESFASLFESSEAFLPQRKSL